jgi:transposase
LKTPEEVMEILEAFDLAGSLRGAAELVGCDHKTVAHWVRARDEAGGGLPVSVRSRPRVDAFAEKIEEWVDRSRGKIRADAAHQKLVAMGYLGSERTTRRAIAEAKRRWRAEHGRRTRPWIPEPGLWMQWDYGDGPDVAGRRTVLFCAWLAWSRFRFVLPLWDKTTPSVMMALDRALRAFGGAPTYALTDNEKTVSSDHIAGIAVRNPQIVSVARHYGLSIETCVRRPAEQGRLRGDGPDREGRSCPDRAQPARRIRGLRAARAGLPGVLRPRQRARAPDHAPRASGDAGRGTSAAAPAAGDAAHDLLRPDAQGVLAVDDRCVGAHCGRRRRDVPHARNGRTGGES